MPYRYLLPTQIVFIVVMAAATFDVARAATPLGDGAHVAGTTMVWASYVYAIGMTMRAVRYALAPPHQRGVLIPIVFHFVLAAFLFVWGNALRR
jgi:hypothetical protein